MSKTIAFIPVRGGSKSIPLKNIKLINGKPLVYWTVKAAQDCENIDEIYISTDSQDIRNTVLEFQMSKVKVIERSPETATDEASTESAMLEFAGQNEFDTIVLIQATSPLLTKVDLEKGFGVFKQPDVDSVLSVVEQKRFMWAEEAGYVYPTNYDVYKRPRRQDFEGFLIENGAFYITSRQKLLETQNRISGRIKAVKMKEASYFEIDEPSDWMIVENLMKKTM